MNKDTIFETKQRRENPKSLFFCPPVAPRRKGINPSGGHLLLQE